MLGLRFAYATNGNEIIEIDYTTGLERTVAAYPTPEELWQRYRAASAFLFVNYRDDTLGIVIFALDQAGLGILVVIVATEPI